MEQIFYGSLHGDNCARHEDQSVSIKIKILKTGFIVIRG